MPALAPYIPPKDAAFGSWLDNFSALLTASPSTYGQTSGVAAAVAAVTATWDAAYALVTSPSTKTKDTVQAKNVARIDALATVKPVAQQISLNQGVLASDKVAIGVNPRTSTPVPVTAPTTYPLLTLVSNIALQVIIRYRDELASPSVKSKPYGVVQVQLFASTSATPITDPTLLQFLGVRTKSPTTVTWASSASGLRAYYAARWVTRTGLVGPWSPIVNGIVGG
jgi:hypothetical protein